MYGSRRFIALIFVLPYLEGKLPDFIKPCSRSDPNLSTCIQEHAKEAIPILAEGVKELNIPLLKKFKLPLIHSPSTLTYSLIFDGILEGLKTIQYLNTAFDYRTLTGRGRIFFPLMKLSGRYILEGTIQNVPISGAGNANITLSDLSFYYTFEFIKYSRNGEIYLTVPRGTFKWYEIISAKYDFENLFNGNWEHDAELNSFLNRNWELLSDGLIPQLGLVVLKLITEVANIVMTTTPVDQFILP